jgi:hypothetical protein
MTATPSSVHDAADGVPADSGVADLSRHPRARRVLIVLWPAFLAACALELSVFAFVDPAEMHWLGRHVDWPRQAVYALAFFGFWLIAALACTLALVLGDTPAAAPAAGQTAAPDAAAPRGRRRRRGR